ncbi:MAG TPA: hypothetical protein VFG76_07755, partial [Candidatus Polarisedimenticolia bacterium]|nr:hypothetical protein [Candidatus Polarisedimenticolia bacterium]
DPFDMSIFASTGFFDLLRSPGDLLLTALAIFATALLLLRASGRIVSAPDASGRGRRPRVCAAP